MFLLSISACYSVAHRLQGQGLIHHAALVVVVDPSCLHHQHSYDQRLPTGICGASTPYLVPLFLITILFYI